MSNDVEELDLDWHDAGHMHVLPKPIITDSRFGKAQNVVIVVEWANRMGDIWRFEVFSFMQSSFKIWSNCYPVHQRFVYWIFCTKFGLSMQPNDCISHIAVNMIHNCWLVPVKCRIMIASQLNETTMRSCSRQSGVSDFCPVLLWERLTYSGLAEEYDLPVRVFQGHSMLVQAVCLSEARIWWHPRSGSTDPAYVQTLSLPSPRLPQSRCLWGR